MRQFVQEQDAVTLEYRRPIERHLQHQFDVRTGRVAGPRRAQTEEVEDEDLSKLYPGWRFHAKKPPFDPSHRPPRTRLDPYHGKPLGDDAYAHTRTYGAWNVPGGGMYSGNLGGLGDQGMD